MQSTVLNKNSKTVLNICINYLHDNFHGYRAIRTFQDQANRGNVQLILTLVKRMYAETSSTDHLIYYVIWLHIRNSAHLLHLAANATTGYCNLHSNLPISGLAIRVFFRWTKIRQNRNCNTHV